MESAVADEAESAQEYLEHLVLAAISGRSGQSSDVAGRVVAVLLEALTAAGGAERAAGYLAPAPGSECRFELVGATGTPGDVAGGELAQLFESLAEAAAEGDDGLGVDAVGPDGTRRRALEQTEDGVAAYVFPSLETLSGPPAGVRDALGRWAWTMSTWARTMIRDGAPAPVDAVATSRDGELDTGGADGTAGLVQAVRSAMADIAVEVDLRAVEGAVANAIAPAMEDAGRQQRADTDELRGALMQQLAGLEPAVVAERIADRLAADRPADPDPIDIDALAARLARALPPAPQVPEPIDIDALAARLAESTSALAGHPAGVTAGADLPPDPDDGAPAAAGGPIDVDVDGVAAAVVEALGEVIDTAVATSDVERDVSMRALRAASEQLQVQIDGFGDRIRSGTRALESLADSVASGSRGADAYTQRLEQSLTASIDRLGRRIEQLERSTHGIEAADSSGQDPPDGPAGEDLG